MNNEAASPRDDSWQLIEKFDIEDGRHFLAYCAVNMCIYSVCREGHRYFHTGGGNRECFYLLTHARPNPAPPPPVDVPRSDEGEASV